MELSELKPELYFIVEGNMQGPRALQKEEKIISYLEISQLELKSLRFKK